jgi:hypothetical protein
LDNFWASAAREGAQRRIATALKHGLQDRTEVELRMGAYLAGLDEASTLD